MVKSKSKDDIKKLISKLDDFIMEELWPVDKEDQEKLVSLAYQLFDDVELPDIDKLEFELQKIDKLSQEYLIKVDELKQAVNTSAALTVIGAILTGLHKAKVLHGLVRSEVEGFKNNSLVII